MSDPVVREPRQKRSRDTWHKALDIGLLLLREGGVEALTVSEVCRRAEMSPPSLYARVDGRSGLIAAVYERAMDQVRATEEELFRLPTDRSPTDGARRVADVVDATVTQFVRNREVLRPIVSASLQNDWVRRRGVEESRRLISSVAAALGLGDEVGTDIGTMLFSELTFFIMYGVDFASPAHPEISDIRERLKRMAQARADQARAGR